MPHQVRPVYEVKAGLFRVLGHPARVRIIELLRDGERSVGALQAELGLESGATSQHLSALRRVGLVESGGTGRAFSIVRRTSRCSTCWTLAARWSRGSSRGSSRCCASSRSRDLAAARGGRRRRGLRRRRCSRSRASVPGRARRAGGGCRAVGRGGILGARRRASAGEPFTSAFAPRARRRPPHRLVPRRARRGRGRPSLVVRDPLPARRPAGPRDRRADGGCSSLVQALVLVRARPAHVPRRLGGDDARPGGDDPRRAAPTSGAPRGVLLRRGDASRGRGDVGRDPAARARGRDRRPDRGRVRLRACRSRSRSPRSSGWARRPA